MNIEEYRSKIKNLKKQKTIIIEEIRVLNFQVINLNNKNEPEVSARIQELNTQVSNKRYTIKFLQEIISYLVELEPLISNLDDKKIGIGHVDSLELSTNDHIYIPNEGITGILLYECKEPLNTWSVLIKQNDKMIIRRVHINQIRPYENNCWYCGTEINGINHTTCHQCHWTICPNCGRCRKFNCEPDNIIIEVKDNSSNRFNQFSFVWNNPPLFAEDKDEVNVGF